MASRLAGCDESCPPSQDAISVAPLGSVNRYFFCVANGIPGIGNVRQCKVTRPGWDGGGIPKNPKDIFTHNLNIIFVIYWETGSNHLRLVTLRMCLETP